MRLPALPTLQHSETSSLMRKYRGSGMVAGDSLLGSNAAPVCFLWPTLCGTPHPAPLPSRRERDELAVRSSCALSGEGGSGTMRAITTGARELFGNEWNYLIFRYPTFLQSDLCPSEGGLRHDCEHGKA